MDYITLFTEKQIGSNPQYPRNDIGTAQLFYDLHSHFIRYVREAKTWYVHNGQIWDKDEGGFKVMEMCKVFTQSLSKYAEIMDDASEESKAFIKYTAGLTGRKKREGILADARSIQPMSLTDFDRSRALFNCRNGTYNLAQMDLLPHDPTNYITKLANVEYTPGAVCERWERFIIEIMSGDMETARFLQKAFGYCLSGGTSLECFFILYGASTRNGKSTLTETVGHILADYARTIQPQTLSRRPNDGATPSPDIARLKGARLVNTPEPEKAIKLNTALIKQLTGGDTYTGRYLHENPVEYKPEFKIFINTNHLPRTDDQTIFLSDRVKLIPFERHFKADEQDKGLKRLFQKKANKSGILNWLIEGYRLLQAEGLILPDKVIQAIKEYSLDGDDLGIFLREILIPAENHRLKTSDLNRLFTAWGKPYGLHPISSQEFVGELRRRKYLIKADRAKGNVIMGYALKYEAAQN
jgi:putative DNA primase/helicase